VLWSDIEPVSEYLDAASPDKGFFWLGPAGTKTPYHHDLTNNFMAQVIGRKRIKMVPLHDTAYMYNNLHCYSEVDAGAVDYERFPAMRKARVLECTLEPGELLFIPIGWWHYVEGLDASVTMSFTNFLRFNAFADSYTTYDHL
jgi:ribosomal protein L16 Arg81 hydroxylase